MEITASNFENERISGSLQLKWITISMKKRSLMVFTEIVYFYSFLFVRIVQACFIAIQNANIQMLVGFMDLVPFSNNNAPFSRIIQHKGILTANEKHY